MERLDWPDVVVLLLAIASGVMSFAIVGAIAQRFGQQLLDIPNERSSHTRPTPRGGGLGFVLAFAIAAGLAALAPLFQPFLPASWADILGSVANFQPPILLMGAVLLPLAIVGFIDDRQGVSSAVRYLVQLGTAGMACYAFGAFPFPWLESWGLAGQVVAIALSLFGFTALVNFSNFMDGIDGIVAGVSAVQLGFLALYLQQPILWLLVAALLGFLWWNWSPAKIFMGDVGSTVLGATVAIALFNVPDSNPTLAWSALAVTLPLTGDAVYTILCRLRRGENVFQAHRTHLYQRLHQAGWPHAQVSTLYIGLALVIALLIASWPRTGAWLSLAIVLLAILGGEIYLARSRTSLSMPEL